MICWTAIIRILTAIIPREREDRFTRWPSQGGCVNRATTNRRAVAPAGHGAQRSSQQQRQRCSASATEPSSLRAALGEQLQQPLQPFRIPSKFVMSMLRPGSSAKSLYRLRNDLYALSVRFRTRTSNRIGCDAEAARECRRRDRAACSHPSAVSNWPSRVCFAEISTSTPACARSAQPEAYRRGAPPRVSFAAAG